jgi:hypothetical protein
MCFVLFIFFVRIGKFHCKRVLFSGVVWCVVVVIHKHSNLLFLYQVNLFVCVPKQMSRKAMKSPIGAHTPQAMLLAAGVSLTKVVFISVSPSNVFLLLKSEVCVCVCVFLCFMN